MKFSRYQMYVPLRFFMAMQLTAFLPVVRPYVLKRVDKTQSQCPC